MSSGVLLPTAAKASNPGCVTETLFAYQHKDRLEEDMASHSSIPAQRIPGTEKPSGLQSMGLQRAGQGGSDGTHAYMTLLLDWVM